MNNKEINFLKLNNFECKFGNYVLKTDGQLSYMFPSLEFGEFKIKRKSDGSNRKRETVEIELKLWGKIMQQWSIFTLYWESDINRFSGDGFARDVANYYNGLVDAWDRKEISEPLVRNYCSEGTSLSLKGKDNGNN